MTRFLRQFLIDAEGHKPVFSAFGSALRKELQAQAAPAAPVRRVCCTKPVSPHSRPRISVQ